MRRKTAERARSASCGATTCCACRASSALTDALVSFWPTSSGDGRHWPDTRKATAGDLLKLLIFISFERSTGCSRAQQPTITRESPRPREGTSSPLRCTARFWHASAAAGLFLKIGGGTLPSRSLERAGSLAGRGSRTLGVNVEELLELHDEKKIIQKADVTGFAKSCGLSRQQTDALLNPPVLLASGLLPPFRLQEPARQRDYADRRWPHLVAHRHTRRGEATGPCGGGACDFKRAQAARQRRPQRLRRLVTTTFA